MGKSSKIAFLIHLVVVSIAVIVALILDYLSKNEISDYKKGSMTYATQVI